MFITAASNSTII